MKNSTIYALVDCNNFFVSCERVFQPQYRNSPAVVLSNNDGCIVARSQEVKAMGVPMAAPYFEFRDLLRQKKVKVFSANFTLYSDMSRRVMQCLYGLSPEVEIYSIDEAFMHTSGLSEELLNEFGLKVKNSVYRDTGIPVSVGIAKTKTLAKLANELSKKESQFKGVLSLGSLKDNEIDQFLQKLPIYEIWGIGWRLSKRFAEHGIESAWDFKYANPDLVQRVAGIMGYRVQAELKGIPHFTLDSNPDGKKSIACTRSFGHRVTSYRELEEGVASYAANACEKLRAQKSLAGAIYVFIHTDPHKVGERFYSNGATMKLKPMSCDTRVFTDVALKILKSIFVPGLRYKKAGVYITDIMPENSVQLSLFDRDDKAQRKLAEIFSGIDKVNKEWGHGTLRLAVEGVKQNWHMKRELVSKRFTTNWTELAVVR